MEDPGIPGRIYTIDTPPADERFPCPIDWGDGTRAHVEHLAWKEVLPKAALATWVNRIEFLTSFSGQVMRCYHAIRAQKPR